jgi:alpha-mannosidase
MHDEAGTHYVDMIDQTTLGHRFLKDTFGVTPTVGWQIDPFGHSATQAALLSAEVGFTGLYFARIDWEDSVQRILTHDLEFIWRASPSLGAAAQVFTGKFMDGISHSFLAFCKVSFAYLCSHPCCCRIRCTFWFDI